MKPDAIKHRPTSKIASPCIGSCCLDYDDICQGCFRSITEILAWSEATDTSKAEMLARVEERKNIYKATR